MSHELLFYEARIQLEWPHSALRYQSSAHYATTCTHK
jgi:hypothetical protein